MPPGADLRRYHDQMSGSNGLVNYYLGAKNDEDGGAEPIPKSGLINDKKTETFDLKPGRKHLFRIINMSGLAAQFVKFDGHSMTVVAIDGVPVVPKTTDTIYLSAAQRYDVIITGLQKPTKNYAFIVQMDNDMFDTPQPDSVTIANGVLRYNSKFPDPAPLTTHGDALDDMTLVPADGQKILPTPDVNIVTTLNFGDVDLNGQKVQR
jgi:iron transport multicopper oxidase